MANEKTFKEIAAVAVAQDLYHEKLLCHVTHVGYSYMSRTGELFLPKGNCPDMTASIEFFEAIDQRIEMVKIWVNSELDTIYIKMKDGQWVVFDARKSKT